MAVPRHITFPPLKQEAGWAPQELSFPGIKDEVLDDEADCAWWELKPCKQEPGFQAVKDEVLEHDYQEGAAPLRQDLSSSNTGYFGCEDTQEWCDEDLSTSQMRHTNKFMIDSDPEELDEFLHCNIALESKEANAQTDTCDNNFVCKEFLKGCAQDGGNAVNSLTRPLVASQLDHDTKKILFSSAHSPEDVIIIIDDDDDDDNHNEDDFHDSGIDDNDPVVTDNGCGPSGSECGNDIETIVIDDDDDSYTNSLDCELQQEKNHIKSAHNGLEFSADIPIAPTKKRKRKRKQEKNNIKCILQFDGNETKKIPVISKEKSTNTVKSNKKTRVSQSMNSEVNIDMAQEISLNQALHNDKEQPTNSVDKASFKKFKMSNQLETSETDDNGGMKIFGLEDKAQKVNYTRLLQKRSSESTLKNEEREKSENNMKKFYKLVKKFQKIERRMKKAKQTDGSAYKLVQSDMTSSKFKQCNIHVNEDENSENSAVKIKYCNDSVQEMEQCDKSKQFCEPHKTCTSAQQTQQSSSPMQKPPEKIIFSMKKAQQFLQKFFELIQHNNAIQDLQIQTTSMKSNQCSHFDNASQECIFSKEMLLYCTQLIKELSNCITSVKLLQKEAESRNNAQQQRVLFKVLQHCVMLVNKLNKCYKYIHKIHHTGTESFTEFQQVKAAAGNFETRESNQSRIDVLDFEKQSSKFDVTNSYKKSQSTEKFDQSKNVVHHRNISLTEKRMDYSESELDETVQLFHNSCAITKVVLNSIAKQMTDLSSDIVCTLCSQKIKSQAGLKTHIRRKHFEVTLRYCSECQKSFSTYELLIKHYKTDHLKVIHKFHNKHRHSKNKTHENCLLPAKKRRRRLIDPASIQWTQKSTGTYSKVQQEMHHDVNKSQAMSATASQQTQNNACQQNLEGTSDLQHSQPILVSLLSENTMLNTVPIPLHSGTSILQSSPVSSGVSSAPLQSITPPTHSMSAWSSHLHSEFSPLQSDAASSHTRPHTLQPIPTASWQSNLTPLFTRNVPLQQNHTTSNLHHIPSHSKYFSQPDSATEFNRTFVNENTFHEERSLPKRRPISLSMGEYTLINNMLKKTEMYERQTYTSHKGIELNMGPESYQTQEVTCDSKFNKGDTASRIIYESAETMCPRDKNSTNHDGDLINSTNNSLKYGSGHIISMTSFPVIENDNVRSARSQDTNYVSSDTNRENHNIPSSLYPKVHRRPRRQHFYNCPSSGYSSTHLNLSNNQDLTQQLAVNFNTVGGGQQRYKKCNCRNTQRLGQLRASLFSSSVPNTVFSGNLADQRHIPANSVSRDPCSGTYNHREHCSNELMSQPAIPLRKQSVIIANYNTVTYIQDNIPCVV